MTEATSPGADARNAASMVAGGVVFAVTTALVAQHVAPFPGERDLLRNVSDLPRGIGAPLELLMQLGTLPVALAIVLVIAVLTRAEGVRPAIAALVAVLAVYWLTDVVKELVARPRPVLPSEGLGEPTGPGGFAYPSGHAAMAFAVASLVAQLVPRSGRWLVFLVAVLAATARLYVGVHWPIDLIGGAALGVTVASAAKLLISEL